MKIINFNSIHGITNDHIIFEDNGTIDYSIDLNNLIIYFNNINLDKVHYYKFNSKGKVINKNIVCDNYKQFMLIIHNLQKNIDGIRIKNLYYMYYIDSKSNKLYLFTYNYKNITLECVYNYKYSKIYNMLEMLLTNNAKCNNYIEICINCGIANADNYKEIIFNYYILELLLCTTTLECTGKNKIDFTYQKRKKSGGYRTIIVPNVEYKECLKHFDTMLQKKIGYINDKFQVAYKKGKGIYDNALAHVENNYHFYIDLHDFYGSCTKDLVYNALDSIMLNHNKNKVALNMFTNAICLNGSLFMGNPASGSLANYIISKAVGSMYAECNVFNIKMTVYSDDITFSSSKFLHKDYCIKIWNRAFKQYGLDSYFSLSEDKCHGAINNKRKITGCVVNHKNQLTIRGRKYNDIKVSLHQMSYNKPTKLKPSTLKGNLAFMFSVDRSGKFVKLMSQYRDTLINNNLFSAETIDTLIRKNLEAIEEFNKSR